MEIVFLKCLPIEFENKKAKIYGQVCLFIGVKNYKMSYSGQMAEVTNPAKTL